MRNFILINNSNVIKFTLRLHEDNDTIDNYEFEKDDTDEIIEISNEVYENFILLNESMVIGEHLFYDKDTKTIILAKDLIPEENII